MCLSRGRGWMEAKCVPREKHVNKKSFHQPLMDVLIFSGQHRLTPAMHYNNLLKKQLASTNGLLRQCLDLLLTDVFAYQIGTY